ncbi:MAG: carbohydrate ABC transporter permease [Provencibacterium sp.]|nr:carbohydrate ABC transporter permease [Provencibacterium sp.]
MTIGDRVFTVANYLFLFAILVIVAYPILYVTSASFSSPYAVSSGKMWIFPVDFNLRGYTAVFKNRQILRSFLNSVMITAAGTGLNIVLTIMAAYPLSRKTFYGRGVFTGIMAFTMFFSGGMVPTFLLIRDLHLYDSMWALILPGAVGVSNVIIARTYFQTSIPEELYEAGQLDGCSEAGFLLRIVLPLSVPIIAVLVMYYAVGHWNSYFNALIYIKDQDKQILQVVLKNILIESQMMEQMMVDVAEYEERQGLSDLLKYSTIVIGSLPMLILYPFVQKHFVKGVMVGAIKG